MKVTAETFRGIVASLTAAAAVLGGSWGAYQVWVTAVAVNPTPETAGIFGVFTGLIAAGTTFLFVQEAASRASHASERGFDAGTFSGARLPEQAATVVPLEPVSENAVSSSGSATSSTPGG